MQAVRPSVTSFSEQQLEDDIAHHFPHRRSIFGLVLSDDYIYPKSFV